MKSPRTDQLRQMHAALRALADPTRLRILGLLAGGEICVCHIHETLGVPQPTASRHLAYLRRAGLVDTRREGLWVHYRLAEMPDDVVRTVVATVTHCVEHVESVARDRKRLERATDGKCRAAGPLAQPGLACCTTGK